MRDVLGDIASWYAAGETFGLATVVNTFRSAPRPPGATTAGSSPGAPGTSTGTSAVKVTDGSGSATACGSMSDEQALRLAASATAISGADKRSTGLLEWSGRR